MFLVCYKARIGQGSGISINVRCVVFSSCGENGRMTCAGLVDKILRFRFVIPYSLFIFGYVVVMGLMNWQRNDGNSLFAIS